jgi:hypothetical protein
MRQLAACLATRTSRDLLPSGRTQQVKAQKEIVQSPKASRAGISAGSARQNVFHRPHSTSNIKKNDRAVVCQKDVTNDVSRAKPEMVRVCWLGLNKQKHRWHYKSQTSAKLQGKLQRKLQGSLQRACAIDHAC